MADASKCYNCERSATGEKYTMGTNLPWCGIEGCDRIPVIDLENFQNLAPLSWIPVGGSCALPERGRPVLVWQRTVAGTGGYAGFGWRDSETGHWVVRFGRTSGVVTHWQRLPTSGPGVEPGTTDQMVALKAAMEHQMKAAGPLQILEEWTSTPAVPEHHERVLVCVAIGGWTGDVGALEQATAIHDEGGWNVDGPMGEHGHPVTHWRPLPTLPGV